MTAQPIICVCGAHSGCGKTTVAEALLKTLRGSWCAVKYTKTDLYTSVSRNPEAPGDKDTSRLLRAGAGDVVWIQAPETELADALGTAFGMLDRCEGILIEGNSPIEFLTPDVVIFVFGRDPGRMKPSASRILEKADVLVYHGETPETDLASRGQDKAAEVPRLNMGKRGDLQRLKTVVMEILEGKATSERPARTFPGAFDVEKRLLSRSRDLKIGCSEARRLAEEAGIPYREIGRMADELGIKITTCELGCF